MTRRQIVLTVVAALVVVVLLAVGGWFLHWRLTESSTNRQARINQDTFGRQNALVEAVLDDIKDAETPGIPAGQRIAIVDQVCHNAALLTGSIQLPLHAQQFVLKECPK